MDSFFYAIRDDAYFLAIFDSPTYRGIFTMFLFGYLFLAT